MSDATFDGAGVLVTGASSGIGRATAIAFGRLGATVGLVARRAEQLAQVAAEVEEAGGTPVVVAADVTDGAQRTVAVATVIDRAGRLDVLVNAAGIIATGTVETTVASDWDAMFALNVTAPFQMMQLAMPALLATKGTVINVSSVTGLRSFPGILSYATSKAAVDQMTRCAALEMADRGVRINAVNPGVVVSELHRLGGMDDAAYEAFLEHSRTTHPMGRVGQADEVADSIVFLASPQAAWITGATLPIDGGRHLTCAR